MIHHHHDRRVGDYQLRKIWSESPHATTWVAEQISISRKVFFDELCDLSEGAREAFLASARAKAAVAHPFIATIYEAGDVGECCFCAREMHTGSIVREWILAHSHFETGKLAAALGHLAEVGLYHEKHGQSTTPLKTELIHIDTIGTVRVENLVQPGERGANESTRDIAMLGEALVPLVDKTKPGATRMLTLLGWMRGEGIDTPLTWQQVKKFCDQIAEQLNVPDDAKATKHGRSHTRKRKPVLPAIGGLLAALALVAGVVFAMKHVGKAAPAADEPAEIVWLPVQGIAKPSQISRDLVTVGDYATFLQTLDILSADGRAGIFDHPTQPTTKTDHEPSSWDLQLANATKLGKRYTTPVFGVDWWDAAAFATWKKCRLPSEKEWFSAFQDGMQTVSSEWTSTREPNPANPLGRPMWVMITATPGMDPGQVSETPRLWTNDRAQRRLDLGFRLARSQD